MPSIEMEAQPRRALNIFYILDTSGSMEGKPIGTLNDAMLETVDILKDQAQSNADAELKIAVLKFSSGCEWLNDRGPESAEDFIWQNLTAAGVTDVGLSLKELNSKLSQKEYLNSAAGSYLPIIIFMTDGGASDDYKKELAKIRQNPWFNRATKIGFALGDSPDRKMIAEVVGNSEAVIATNDLDVFGRLIKFVSQTASMLCSVSHTTDDIPTGESVVESTLAELNDEDKNKVDIGTGGVYVEPEPVVELDDDWGTGDWS